MNTAHRIAIAITAGCAFATTLQLAIAGPALEDYTVYGHKGVFIGVGSRVYGLTGAGTNDPISNAAIKLNGTASIDGDARAGGNVSLANSVKITGSVYHPVGTALTMGSGSSVGANILGDPELPAFPAATPLPCPTGGQNYTGANSQSLALPAGIYGNLKYGANFNLVLSTAGDYYFESILAANGARIFVNQPGTRIFVCGAAQFGSVAVFPTNLSPCDFSIEVQATGVNAFKAGGSSQWIGGVFAPHGQIHVGSGSSQNGTVLGPLVGNSIDLEHGLIVTNVPCAEPACVAPCLFTARRVGQGHLELVGSDIGLVTCIILMNVNNDMLSLAQLQCGAGDCDVQVSEGVTTTLSLTPEGADVVTTLAPLACGSGTYHVILDTGDARIITGLTITVP